MKIMKILFIAILCFFSVILSISQEKHPRLRKKMRQNEEVFKLPENNDQLEIKVKPQSNFIIRAKGNPSTGYQWYIVNGAKVLNNDILTGLNISTKTFGGEFNSDPNPGGLLGVGGHFEFKFKANKETQAPIVITFSYKRWWEKEIAPLKTVDVKVTISS